MKDEKFEAMIELAWKLATYWRPLLTEDEHERVMRAAMRSDPGDDLSWLVAIEQEVEKRLPAFKVRSMGVPDRFLECSWETWHGEVTPQLQQLKSWTGGLPKTTAFLWGPVGTGKTHLAVATIRRLGGRFVQTGSIIREVRQSFGGVNGPSHDLLSEIAETDGLVVLDDFLAGQGRITDWVKDSLSWLVSCRHADNAPLLITSNASLNEVAALIDPRVASRLAEGLVIKLDGKDRRLP